MTPAYLDPADLLRVLVIAERIAADEAERVGNADTAARHHRTADLHAYDLRTLTTPTIRLPEGL